MTDEEEEQLLTKFIIPMWRGLSNEYKSKYRMNIWDQFGEALRGASYTTDLKKFYNTMLRRLPITIRAEDRNAVVSYIQDNDEKGRVIIALIRNQYAYVVACVQVANDARKQEIKQEELF